jgi:hypothetical protein
LDTCLFTCGLAPVTRDVREVYIATYRRLLVRNRCFYTRYPEDVARVKEVVSYLHAHSASPIRLPGGGHLTVRRFLQLGIMLGLKGGMDSLHYLLEEAFFATPTAAGSLHGAVLNESFLHAVEREQSGFESSPIYWLLHESIYMNGAESVSAWAAEEVMLLPEFREAFDYTKALTADASDLSGYVNFTGEMVYSWMAEDYARLRPLQAAAHQLAHMKWGRQLYDLEALRNVEALHGLTCIVVDDMSEERSFSEETAALLEGRDVCAMVTTDVTSSSTAG